MKLNWVYACRNAGELWMKYFYARPTKSDIAEFKKQQHITGNSLSEYVGIFDENEQAWVAVEGS